MDRITKETFNTIKKSGTTIDRFGQELNIGDWVLCKGYRSMTYGNIAQVQKISKTNIKVEVEKTCCNSGDYNVKGNWREPLGTPRSVYPNYKKWNEYVLMDRHPLDVIKVTDIKPQLDNAYGELVNKFPEAFL